MSKNLDLSSVLEIMIRPRLLILFVCYIKLTCGSHLPTEYITRIIGEKHRKCIPIYDCPPGHEILPCTTEFNSDICRPCPKGQVQPLYVSSSVDLNSTMCFENKNKEGCIAHDIRPSRTNEATMCTFVEYCECDLEKCNYGDPCSCDARKPCGFGETMDKNGECVKCPEGTEKLTKGCGQCRQITKPISIPKVPEVLKSTTTVQASERSRKKNTFSSDVKLVKTDIPNIAPLASDDQGDESSTDSLIAVVAVLAILCFAGTLFLLLYLLKSRKGESDQNKRNNVSCEILPLVERNGNDPVERRVERLVENEKNNQDNLPNNHVPLNRNALNIEKNIAGVHHPKNTNSKLGSIEQVDVNTLQEVITDVVDGQDVKPANKGSEPKKNENRYSDEVFHHVTDFQDIRNRSRNSSEVSNSSGEVAKLTLGTFSGPYTQVTEKLQSPVTVASDCQIFLYRDPVPLSTKAEKEEENLSSCLEYHNFNVKGQEENECLEATKVKRSGRSYSQSMEETVKNSVDANKKIIGIEKAEIPVNTSYENESKTSAIPTTVFEINSMESIDNNLSKETLIDATNVFNEFQNNKDCTSSMNKVSRQNDKSFQIRQQITKQTDESANNLYERHDSGETLMNIEINGFRQG